MQQRRLGVITGLLAMLGSMSVNADEIVARMSYHWAPKHPSAIHAKAFAEAVNERLKGKFKIELLLRQKITRHKLIKCVIVML
ncbi:MAG: hypothetical protein GKR94_01475 [Gammaproteobacteria bacterium]|nr:hypothetical protein [Gammaproteobacteria bacterium]